MDSNSIEWLNLGLRWAHLIAGISWIGNSFYFMWLDSHLTKPEPPNEKVEGALWMVHSGGFYQVERRKIYPGEMPKVLHWFKWEATFTWVTGFFLLGLIYYLSNGLYLLHPEKSDWSVGTAVTVSFSLLVVSWFLYDFFMQSRLAENVWLRNSILLSVLSGLAYWLTENFNGRAAFIQIGAIFGTLMVLNVWVRILPGQAKMIAATDRGETPDYAHSKIAKARSTHNSYMTLPVLFMMISSHYPGLFGHSKNWLLLLLLCATGAGVRHLMLKGKKAMWTLAPVTAVVAIMMSITASNTESVAGGGELPEFAQVEAIVEARCTSCHSMSPKDRTFGIAPAGVSFDKSENIQKFAERILVRAVQTKTMPLGNATGMTDEERAVLGRWASALRGTSP